jgi:hypothetical protein
VPVGDRPLDPRTRFETQETIDTTNCTQRIGGELSLVDVGEAVFAEACSRPDFGCRAQLGVARHAFEQHIETLAKVAGSEVRQAGSSRPPRVSGRRYSDVLHGAGVGSMRATGSRAFSQAASYQGHATFACSAQRRLRPSRLLGSGQRTPAGRNWMLIRGPSVRDRLGTLCSHVR